MESFIKDLQRKAPRILQKWNALPTLLLRQPKFGVGRIVEEQLSGRRAVITRVLPVPGGLRARIFLLEHKEAAPRLVKEDEAWGGKWRLVEGINFEGNK